MNLLDMIMRVPIPEPWGEGEKIPWNDPDFSERMLKEHLSQSHDAASRRFEKIDRQVAWIHSHVLGETPTRILDLGCGPGLYTSRLARLGHICVGIDFSPASVAYAKTQVEQASLACTYIHEDIRQADYGTGYGLAMLIFGEFNVFRPEVAEAILRKAHHALSENGCLLLEPHTFNIVQTLGEAASSWYSTASGLFSAHPHLCLEENFWDAERAVTTTRYFIIDATTGVVTRHAASMQAYTDEDYRALLADCGFSDVTFFPSLTGSMVEDTYGLFVIMARK
ncbi:MAG: class I SAM-dependent methyltransferase [Anaerolineae bacterium]|nr:class I SAM-dependent methyltransferase [Anaerolineae bacterium]